MKRLGKLIGIGVCMTYFYTGQGEKALKLFEASEKQFARYRNRKQIGGGMEAAYILAAIQRGQLGEARALLEHAKSTWTQPRMQQSFQRLEDGLKQAERTAGAVP